MRCLLILICFLISPTACNDRSSSKITKSPPPPAPMDIARLYLASQSLAEDQRRMGREEAFMELLDEIGVPLPESTSFLAGISDHSPGETGSSIQLEIDPKELPAYLQNVRERWSSSTSPHLTLGERSFVVNPGSPASTNPLLSAFGLNSVELFLTNEKPERKAWIRLKIDPDSGLVVYTWSRP